MLYGGQAQFSLQDLRLDLILQLDAERVELEDFQLNVRRLNSLSARACPRSRE